MKVAVEGCAHGELDKIYDSIAALERKNGFKVDLLLICGDFQSVRNTADLECMAVPPKYRHMQTFYKYYSGEKIAPVLTIFIGGNHEASNFLSELPYGGWVAPKIFYMGYANVLNVGGLRIAGLSGIYKPHDYMKGHFECLPYDESSKKSVYHIRNVDVFRLKQIKEPVDIILSHDWPTGVYNYGDARRLLKCKPFFRKEVESNTLGSQPAREIMDTVKPKFWFSAHLHCKFTAVVPHEDNIRTYTKFLALDKCLPRRSFLQVLDFEGNTDDLHLDYDPEWLSILISTNHLTSTSRVKNYIPRDVAVDPEVRNRIKQLYKNGLRVPNNFIQTAPTHPSSQKPVLKVHANPQTDIFCQTLNITDIIKELCNKTGSQLSISDFTSTDASSYFSTDEVSFSDHGLVDSSDMESSYGTPASAACDATQETSNSEDFFIDSKGSHQDVVESDDFFIDKIGSNPDSRDSDEIVNLQSKPRSSLPTQDNAKSKDEASNSQFRPRLNLPIANSTTIKDAPFHPDSRDSDQIVNLQSKPRLSLPSQDNAKSKDEASNSQFRPRLNLPSANSPTIKDAPSQFRSKLSLPSPSAAVEKLTESFPQILPENSKRKSSEGAESSPVPVQKFRRRNYDLYKSECDAPV